MSARRRRDGSLLETVLLDGMVMVSRAKLPSRVKRERERGEVWREIYELYEELQDDPEELREKRVGSHILITRLELDENPYAGEAFEPKALK